MEKKVLIIGSLVVLLFLAFFIFFTENYNFLTGGVTGIAKVEVECIMMISLPVSSVDFGKVVQGAIDDTDDNSPMPMLIQNDGQIRVDVSLARDNDSTPLFSGTGGGDNTTSFQFKIDQNESNSFNFSASLTNWTNVPGTGGINAIYGLKYSDSNDAAEIDLKIQVPSDEPAGTKNETLLFIASASAGAECGDENGNNVSEEDAECLLFNLSSSEVLEIQANITCGDDEEEEEDEDDAGHGGRMRWHCAGKRLKDVGIENICNHSITITKAKVSWIADNGEKIEKIKFSGTSGFSWLYFCWWGCSPTGKQPSGTLLDFGSKDYVIPPYSNRFIRTIEFDSDMQGKNLDIELTLSDASTKSTGNFSP